MFLSLLGVTFVVSFVVCFISLIRELEVAKLKYGKENKEHTDCNINTHQYKEDTRLVESSDNSSGLMETVHLLKSPANAAHLAESIEQYRKGQSREYGLVDD